MSVINFLFHFVSFNQNFKGENFPTFESEEEEEFADTFDHMSPKKVSKDYDWFWKIVIVNFIDSKF